MLALDFGLSVVKFFPAEAFGGLNTLKALGAPFTTVKFIPTGGIGPRNLAAYLAYPQVFACGGTWIAASELLASGRFDDITRLAREAVEIAAKVDKKT
jgi:2-dehydro-3-deoxyphosphogluconate aldolase/(4S)-4-hydroxy-2-oxoglutarate aldolase